MWFNIPILGEVGLFVGKPINPLLTTLFAFVVWYMVYICYEIYKKYIYKPVFVLKKEYIVNTVTRQKFKRNPDGTIDAVFEEL